MPGPVVVGILSHRDPALVRRLVARVLEGRDTVVLSHHDPRGPDLGLPASDRLHRVPDPRPASWGRMGFADTMLRTLDVARTVVPDLSWVLLVSGQDYPCRPLPVIEAELHASRCDAYVRNFRVDGDPARDVHHWQGITRRRYLHRRRLPATHRSIPWPRRHPFGPDLGLYAGDVWVNLGAAAVDHVLAQRERRTEVRRYLAARPLPDEAYLATLLLNDAGHLDIVNKRRRYIRWTSGESHPAFLNEDDARAAAGGTDFFARKCDSVRTAEALDVLDRTVTSAKPGTEQEGPT